MTATTTTKQVSVTITLTELEARWLKALVQNPIGCLHGEESGQDAAMRETFWRALSDANI